MSYIREFQEPWAEHKPTLIAKPINVTYAHESFST